ncbi:DUF2523 family protein [Vibrio astriarenae]
MDWIIDLYNKLKEYLLGLLESFFELFKDFAYWIFELLMMVVDGLLATIIAILEPVDISQYLTGFPSGAAWMFGQIGLPQCLTMIGTAIVVRLMLQLIPFVRLGS